MLTRVISYRGEMLAQPFRRRRGRLAGLHQAGHAIATAVEATLEGCGLSMGTVSAAGIPGSLASRVTAVDIDDPVRVTVQLRAGTVASDLIEIADRIADGLRVEHVDIRATRPGMVVIRAYRRRPNPWELPVTLPLAVPSVHHPLFLGRSAEGEDIRASLTTGAHAVVQGLTQSGKSTFLYGLLGQLSDAPDVIVGGSDPSGILLRPWSKRRDQHAGWQALGTDDLGRHVEILARLVKRMDHRIAGLPDGAERVEISPDCPLVVCVLEEFPGLLKALARADRKLRDEALALYSRLMAEGLKAGIRCLIVAQRADAEILGGYERGQASLRLTFAVDTPDAVLMLHPSVDRKEAARHGMAEPGVALLSMRGRPTTTMRAPHVDGNRYWQAVTGTPAGRELVAA